MKEKLEILLNELFEEGYSTGFCDATNKKIERKEQETINEIIKIFESFLLMQSIEKDFVSAGLYMVLSRTRKELYKEDNNSEKVETIHESIKIINNLIKKMED